MHWLDLVIIAVIAWFTFSAFSAGLIRELVTAIAIVAGAVIAGRFYAELAADIEFLIGDDTTRNFVAFVAIFAGIVVVGQVVAVTLRQAAAVLLLGPFDHLGGAFFGFAKGVLLVEVLLIVVTAYPVSAGLDSALDDSTLVPVFLDGVPVMLRLLPGEFSDALEGFDTVAAAASGSSLPVPPPQAIR